MYMFFANISCKVSKIIFKFKFKEFMKVMFETENVLILRICSINIQLYIHKKQGTVFQCT